MGAILELRGEGLYCPAGGFYVDPWRPVERALITHAHGDRVIAGSGAYLATGASKALLRARLGPDAVIEAMDYGERRAIGGAGVSFHPAGHMLGSAQIRIEQNGEIWLFSGDYKVAPDPTCAAFEPLRCHTFLTEAVFALPIFRWPSEADTMAAIHAWWRANREAGKTSLLYASAPGRAQRVLAALDQSIGPVIVQEEVEKYNEIYRSVGQPPRSARVLQDPPAASGFTSAPMAGVNAGRRPGGPPDAPLVIAPPALHNTAWAKRFAPASTALVSGWMRIRGTRRRRALDRGFILSDHADWPGLLRAIGETGAETVWATHGFRDPLARWLDEHGRRAISINTPFAGERDEVPGEEAQ